MHKKNDTLVIGIGNRLAADDGAGPRVLELLQGSLPEACLRELTTPGFDLLTHLEGYRRVFIVDAARFGGRPGEVRRARPDQLRALDPENAFTGHGLGLLQVLEMAEKTGLLPAETVLYCIQAEHLGQGMELSPAVEAAARETARQIKQEL